MTFIYASLTSVDIVRLASLWLRQAAHTLLSTSWKTFFDPNQGEGAHERLLQSYLPVL